MADGPPRSLQGNNNLYPPGRSHPRGPSQRARSPSGGSKLLYNPRSGSPNRSALSKSPRQAAKMYNQNQGHNHHGMMNGAGNQRYGLQMNMAKAYGHQGQQHHGHPHHQQQQDHNAHQGHASNFPHHQHTHSSGAQLTAASLANATQHYVNSLNQNGTSTPSFTNAVAKTPNEHWQKILELAAQAREMVIPHPHARNASGNSRSLLAVGANGLTKESEKEEKTRPIGVVDSSGSENQSWNALDLGGQNLKLVSAALFRYKFLTKLYLGNNRLSVLPPAIGKLRYLNELDLSLNEIRELPPEIGMLSHLTELKLFDNQLETLPNELGMLYQLRILGIEGNPLDEDLKNIIVEEGTQELVKFLRESSTAPNPPVDRPWIVVDETPIPEEDKLTVLSYNVLCERSATQTQHGYTSLQALAWDRRKELVLEEIRARDADIVALQECDMGSYNEFFRAQLAHNDYKGAYQAKGRARTMGEKEGRMVDGSAIFYKNKKYILLEKQVIDLRHIAINRPDMKGESDMFNRVMTRDDIALVLFLENRQTGARLMVTNVHIVWDPKLKDVKVVQTAILLEQISKFAEQWANRPPLSEKEKKTYRFEAVDAETGEDGQQIEVPPQEVMPSQEYPNGASIPLVMCGDYNSLPDSGVYELITQGSLSHLHPDLDNRKYGNLTRDGMTHPFAMKSAYNNVGELKFTNYTPNFVGVLDYIFYSTGSLSVRGLLGDIDTGYLERVPGFPNWHFPSDHICLFAELAVKARKAEKKIVEADFGPSSKKDRHRG